MFVEEKYTCPALLIYSGGFNILLYLLLNLGHHSVSQNVFNVWNIIIHTLSKNNKWTLTFQRCLHLLHLSDMPLKREKIMSLQHDFSTITTAITSSSLPVSYKLDTKWLIWLWNVSFLSDDGNATYYFTCVCIIVSVQVSMWMNVCGIISAESHTHTHTHTHTHSNRSRICKRLKKNRDAELFGFLAQVQCVWSSARCKLDSFKEL